MGGIILTLHDLGYSGEAVGNYEGQVVFVPLGIPGETVRVELTEIHTHYARARLLEVLEPSPDRVTPRCPYFGLCGGCHWQHIAYPAQLRFKRELLLTQLRHLGKQPHPLVRPVIGMDDPWAYRNHVQLTMNPREGLGYQALRSHEVVAVDECWIIHPLLEELWAALDVDPEGPPRVSLRAGVATGEQLILFEGDEDEPPELELDLPVSCVYRNSQGALTILAGNSFYHERLAGRTFRISAPSFFQVNTLQTERMLEVLGEYLALQPHERLLDAYCGVGTFALSFAAQAAHVTGIESSPWSIDDALANRADQETVEFIQGNVEEVLPALSTSYDGVILDPPRAGCAPKALEALARCGASRIIYVSCNPATLARDIARLAALEYELVEVQPIDMFPQTYHLESVALLRRAQGR